MKTSKARWAGILRKFGRLAAASMLVVGAIGPSAVIAAASEPVVTLESGVSGCMGVRATPGSENTDKQLVGGDLDPGGKATFLISYPVDSEDVAGRTTFVITDCVFINDEPVLMYSVSFVPNTENFLLRFTLTIPDDAPIGAEYCNYAKTTAAPSTSQASNRKAGPACFIVGGSLRVLKVDGNDEPLAGADFSVSCTVPTTTASLPVTIIDPGEHQFTSVSGATIDQDVTTSADGAVSVQGPVGLQCTFTEMSAPSGYELPVTASCTKTVTLGSHQTCTFVNLPTPVPEYGLVLAKTNDAPLEELELPDGSIASLPTADAGSTVTYTLSYTFSGDPVTNAVITDVLPAGVTYVDGTATHDTQFTFQGYTAGTRTLTWTAPDLDASGSLSYKVTVDDGAAEFAQPLVNVAAIESDQTPRDEDDSPIFVPTIPLAATGTPRITLPPTDAIVPSQGESNPGFSLMLILLALAAVVLTVGFVTPVPSSVRERARRR
ncbi:hypothetical protein BH20CHL7_BH20CHL7_08310 [soil metagenome]